MANAWHDVPLPIKSKQALRPTDCSPCCSCSCCCCCCNTCLTHLPATAHNAAVSPALRSVLAASTVCSKACSRACWPVPSTALLSGGASPARKVWIWEQAACQDSVKGLVLVSVGLAVLVSTWPCWLDWFLRRFLNGCRPSCAAS